MFIHRLLCTTIIITAHHHCLVYTIIFTISHQFILPQKLVKHMRSSQHISNIHTRTRNIQRTMDTLQVNHRHIWKVPLLVLTFLVPKVMDPAPISPALLAPVLLAHTSIPQFCLQHNLLLLLSHLVKLRGINVPVMTCWSLHEELLTRIHT